MAIKEIDLPLYDSSGEAKGIHVRITEAAGCMCFSVFKETNKELEFECYFSDLERAWDAIKLH